MLSKILSNKYEVKREIGRGGMGVIYEALDIALNRQVAIKVLHAQFSGDAAFLKRFQREARAMARLDHEHIIKVYDVGEAEGLHYIVMEYFSGEDLKKRLSAEPVFPEREAISIALQVSKALSYSHAKGVIHRDIKPANIMVSASGIVKIADFGIAAATDESSLTGTGNIIGTPAYMSPEQANGAPLDGRSDLYSLGMVFYEMLTGKTSYLEVSGRAILIKLATDQKEFKLIFSAHIANSIQDLVGKLLKKNKDNRVRDAKTLSRILAEIEVDPVDPSDKTFVVAESSFPEEIKVRSKWRIYAAGVALLLIIFIGISYRFSREKEEKPKPIPVESSSLDEIQDLQGSIRDIQKKLTTSENAADHPETRRLAAETFDRAVDMETRGTKTLEDAENLILRQDYQGGKEKLQRGLGLFTQANEAYLKATELTGTKKAEEKKKLAEQEQVTRKREKERLNKEKLEEEKKALILLVDAERKKREKLEQENRDREKREKKQLEKKERLEKEEQEEILRAQVARKKSEQLQQENRDRKRREKEKIQQEKKALMLLVETERKKREKLEQEEQERILRDQAERLAREQETRSTRPDIEVTSGLFFNLKRAYEKKDLKSLQEMSEMTPQQARLLQRIFKTYKVIKVKISNFSVTGDFSKAMVSITNLTSLTNKRVIPSKRWKDAQLVVRKKDGLWGKIRWKPLGKL